jgi:hypothetical protein
MSIGNLKDTGNQGNNLPYQWRVLQGLQAILDEVAQPLTCVDDSVTICNDNIDAFTFTNIAGDEALNVNIAGGVTLEVNLDPDNDSVGIYGYTNPANPATFTGIKVDANGELQVDVLTMPATFAEDTAHTSGNTGSFVLGVRNDANAIMTSADGDYSPVAVNANGAVAINDGGNSITVDALNLDIRDLSHLVDTVKIYGSNNANPVATDIAGNIGIQDGGNSITVDGGTGPQRIATFLRPSGSNGTVGPNIYSASFASVGTANAIVGGINLKPGETLNFDAGAINNTLAAITYDTLTNSGAELIIITLT